MKRDKYTITDYFRYSRNLANLLWWKLLILFGVRRSASPIPEGVYCYEPDYVDTKTFTYYVKPCKYYKNLGHGWNGCSYLGIITDDPVFDDQCKMCSENYGDMH